MCGSGDSGVLTHDFESVPLRSVIKGVAFFLFERDIPLILMMLWIFFAGLDKAIIFLLE
jgi:hypothetical protein